jgi:hypothetical protein
MKTTILCRALAAIALFSAPAGSRARADDTSLLDRFDLEGEKRKCIQSYDIDQTQVIDENNVLFRVHVNQYYVNRLSRPCPELRLQQRFKYTLRGTSELCSGDAITVIDGFGMGPGCILGPFEAAQRKKK